MKLKPYFPGLVVLILLGLTASSAFGVGGAGSPTGGTFPACVDPAIANASTVKIGGKQVNPGGLVRVPAGNATCLASETKLNLNSYLKTILVSPGANNAASGTNLQNAMTAATPGTLIKLEPGTYDLGTSPLIMLQGVDLEGSGEGLTTITSQIGGGNFPINSGTVQINNSSEIRFLTIANTASFNFNAAVYANSVNNTAKLTNVTVKITGIGTSNMGILNSSSYPTILNSTITASGATTANIGINNLNSPAPTVRNSTISAIGNGSGSGSNFGISNTASFPIIQNSTIIASGGTLNNSIANDNNSSTRVASSQLTGAVTAAGVYLCVGAYNSIFVALNANCG